MQKWDYRLDVRAKGSRPPRRPLLAVALAIILLLAVYGDGTLIQIFL